MKTTMLKMAYAGTVLCAFLSCASNGAISEARIDEVAAMLPEEPRADGVRASDREKWGLRAASIDGKSQIADGAKLLDKPVSEVPESLYLEFSRNGNRSNYESCYFRRMTNFTKLFVAECLEYKGRFIPKIVEYVDAICAMKSWTLPAHDRELSCFNGTPHVDLFSSDLSLRLAMCHDWLHDTLPEATRAKILSNVERRTFVPHLEFARGKSKSAGHWWLHGRNNWNSVCNSCVLRSALALVKDRRLRAEFVLIAEESIPYAMRGYTDDGYCSEGMGYWNYGFGHHLQMGLSVRAATGGKIDFFSDPKMKEIMKYAYGFQLEAGKSPYFADGGGKPGMLNLALGRQIWPDLVSTTAMKCPLLYGSPMAFSLRAFGQEPAPVAPTMDVLPTRTWFKDAQVLISRIEHPESSLKWSVAFKGGHNAELHNHNDVGSYTVMMDGCEMAGDPGGEVYTRRTFSKDRYMSKMLNSYGHPVPVIGGKLQTPGRPSAAKVLETRFTPEEDSISIDYSAPYPVPALKSLVRTMVFNRKSNTISITDKVAFSEPTTFEVPVVTYRDWKKQNGKMHFTFSKDKGVRTMTLDVAASPPVEFKSEDIENPGMRPPHRLSFSFGKPVLSGEVTMVFTAGK